MSTEKERPITANTLVKWGGIVGMVAGPILTLFLWGANINAKVDAVDAKVARNTAEIVKIEVKQDATDKAYNDLSRKLDVAVAVLERIERTVNKGSP